MAKYYSGIDTSVGVGAETLDGMLASGSEFGIFPSQDIDCQGISASGVAHIIGGIKDTDGDLGNSGQVLSSTGTGLDWIDAGGGGATTINNNADNRIITGSATVNTLNAESSLQYDGNSLFFSDDKAIKFGSNLRMQIYTDGSVNYIKSATDGSGAFPISIHSGSNERVRITSNGSVVIGGDTPATAGTTQLTLRDNGQVGLSLLCGAIQNATITFGGVADGYSSGSSGYDDGKIMYDNSNNHMQFNTAGSERFRIDSGGQIIFQPMTTSERNALSAQAGGVIYNSDDNKLQVYNGSGWVNLH